MKPQALSVVAVLLAIGCGYEGPTPSRNSSAPARSGAVGVAKTEMAGALTEEKLAGFAVYQREMLPMMGLSRNVAMGSLNLGKNRNDPENAAAREERTKALKAAQEAACKKAGIQLSDIPGLTLLTSEYYADRRPVVTLQKDLDGVRKKIADARAAGEEPSPVDTAMEETYLEMLEKEPDIRKEYAAKYGQAVVDLLERHEAEFLEINEQMLDAAMKPATK